MNSFILEYKKDGDLIIANKTFSDYEQAAEYAESLSKLAYASSIVIHEMDIKKSWNVVKTVSIEERKN